MEKYIIIPAEELKGRDKRAFPNGKKVLNPEWVEPAKALDATAKALIEAGATQKNDHINITHEWDGHKWVLTYTNGIGWKSGGAREDSAIANLCKKMGI